MNQIVFRNQNIPPAIAYAYDNLKTQNALKIDSLGVLYFINDDAQKKIYARISSNYEDVYVMCEGNKIVFQLPHRVDSKCEYNLKTNGKNLIRYYSLTVDSTLQHPTLEFVEKYFPDLDKTFILVATDYDIEYEKLATGNFCFPVDANQKLIYNIEPKPLHIYIAFKPERFMSEWKQVDLRDPGEPVNPKNFMYTLQNWKYHFPTINVLQQVNSSPVLHIREELPVRNQQDRRANNNNNNNTTIRSILVNSTEKPKKNQNRNVNNLQPNRPAPPPIISPTDLLNNNNNNNNNSRSEVGSANGTIPDYQEF